ncbi:MAG: ribosomal subunit interface protein [Alphaproteobacteria bacterium HGW-Alphaproteobacteria-12]|nr:MAG: ribosomal subunit interface protein [Alphaproteobacteria bacterium HGW-Alphaproteobacteria-12]
MQVQVSGHHLDVGDALRTHASERLEAAVTKYFERPIDGQVTFTKQGHEFRVECSAHLGSGLRVNAQGSSNEVYASFDAALERLDKRLRRYKRRLKSHNNNNKAALPAESYPSFVIEAGDEHTEEPEDAQPVIIAEGTTAIPLLSVGDAVMQMDLSDAPFVIFRSGENAGLNLVYRRPDGHIGWIDTNRDAQKT